MKVVSGNEHDGRQDRGGGTCASPHARAFVAERLIESLDTSEGGEISAAWREEVSKRCLELDQGTVELRSAADVFAKAYDRLE